MTASADDILAGLDADGRIAAATQTGADTGEWEPLVPLSGHRTLPVFPVDALPAWVADQVAAVAEFTQTPADLPGCIALAALSTAAGGRSLVEVRGSWREPTNIYTAVVMPPGSRKSAVFSAMTAPLLHAERQLVDTTRPHIVEAELSRKIAHRQAEKTAAAAGNATNGARDDAIAEASDAAAAAEAIEVPALPRLVADDVTAESAATLLSEQNGRLAVLSAEGGIFATLAGRYSSGIPNLEVFLKGHAGDMLRVDRKGRPAEHIDHPALTLGLAIQPDVLTDIATMPGFRGRGLLARILYALPPNTVGHRRIGPDPVPEHVNSAYEANLAALVHTLTDWTDPAVLQLSPDADQRVLALEADIEPRLAPGASLGHLADWGSKLTGATVRIAGLLHLAEHLRDGWRQPINADTVEAAARLGDYYAAHALAAFDHMGTNPALDDARAVTDWITRQRTETFTKRDAFRGLPRGRFPTVDRLDPALDLLEQHGHIARAADPPRAGPGRPPSPTFHIHPDLRKDTTHG